MTDNRLQVRLDDGTAGWLAERAARMRTGSSHRQARTELGIWRAVMAAELRRIRLTLAQANCLADALSGSPVTPSAAGAVPVVFSGASEAFLLARTSPVPGVPSYGRKWGIDEDALLGYLRTLGPAADHALHDAICRWREAGADHTVEGWARAGLRVAGDAGGPA